MMMDKSIFGASENAEDDDNADNQKEVSFDQKCTKKLVKQQHHVAFAQVIMQQQDVDSGLSNTRNSIQDLSQLEIKPDNNNLSGSASWGNMSIGYLVPPNSSTLDLLDHVDEGHEYSPAQENNHAESVQWSFWRSPKPTQQEPDSDQEDTLLVAGMTTPSQSYNSLEKHDANEMEIPDLSTKSSHDKYGKTNSNDQVDFSSMLHQMQSQRQVQEFGHLITKSDSSSHDKQQRQGSCSSRTLLQQPFWKPTTL
ncbi:hypothetical protein ACA910_004632 [Epithemia clementina (nom. ined.)]